MKYQCIVADQFRKLLCTFRIHSLQHTGDSSFICEAGLGTMYIPISERHAQAKTRQGRGASTSRSADLLPGARAPPPLPPSPKAGSVGRAAGPARCPAGVAHVVGQQQAALPENRASVAGGRRRRPPRGTPETSPSDPRGARRTRGVRALPGPAGRELEQVLRLLLGSEATADQLVSAIPYLISPSRSLDCALRGATLGV